MSCAKCGMHRARISVLMRINIRATIVFQVVFSLESENFGRINSHAAKYGNGYERSALIAKVKLMTKRSSCVGRLFVMTSDVFSCQVRKPIKAKPVLKIAATICERTSMPLNCDG